MLGSILVVGCIIIAALLAASIYYQKSIINFILIALIFLWSSSSYFFVENYEGWPADGDFPKSQVVAIQIIQPTNIDKGRIFVWLYHMETENKKFWEYYPKNTPRAYEIPYTEQSEKGFSKAYELLQDGNIIVMKSGKSDVEGEQLGEDKDNKETQGKDGYNIIYDVNMPPIQVINPKDILKK